MPCYESKDLLRQESFILSWKLFWLHFGIKIVILSNLIICYIANTSLNLCYNLCYVLTRNHLNAVYISYPSPFIYLYHLLFPVHADEDTALLWAMSLDHYAQFLLKRGHFQEAFNQFQSAFLTNCELQGDTHPQSIVLLNSMGKQPCSLSAYLRRAIDNACFFIFEGFVQC